MNDARFGISQDEIEKVFKPAIGRHLASSDLEWEKLEQTYSEKLARNARSKRFRSWISELLPLPPNYKYESKWDIDFALKRVGLSQGQDKAVVWRDRRYFANGQGIKRVHLSYLMKTIDILRPRRVLEVGSGMGVNLTILAAQYPQIEFAGLELSHAGGKVSKLLAGKQTIPHELADFSPRPVIDPSAHQRVDFRVGSATNIPFPDRTFDLVYSIQALEQMNSFRGKALGEMARVSNEAVVMFEPFRDWNASGPSRHKIVANQYFAAPIKELPRYGLHPVFSTDDMPQKMFYTIGMVVTKKAN